MAWPPTLPPGGRTDATVMAANHPADHNLAAAALADIVNHLNAPWSPVTVSVTQGVAVATSVLRARYKQMGKTVSGSCVINITGAGTPGSAITVNTVGLPAAATYAFTTSGAGRLIRGGTVVVFTVEGSTGAIQFWPHGATGLLGAAHTLGNGDTLYFSFTYEAA